MLNYCDNDNDFQFSAVVISLTIWIGVKQCMRRQGDSSLDSDDITDRAKGIKSIKDSIISRR